VRRDGFAGVDDVQRVARADRDVEVFVAGRAVNRQDAVDERERGGEQPALLEKLEAGPDWGVRTNSKALAESRPQARPLNADGLTTAGGRTAPALLLS
jgi:hypothetical protein